MCRSRGGFWRLEQLQGAVSALFGISTGMALAIPADVSDSGGVVNSDASPTVRNWSQIIPRATHASLLGNSLSESLVIYVICRVSRVVPDFNSPEKRRMLAPSMFIPLLLAATMCRVTGMRSFSRSPKR